MEDLFRDFWWLIFPLGWVIASGFVSALNYRRQQKTLDLIKTYADNGQEPPEALMKLLDRPIDADAEFWSGGSSSESDGGNWFCVVLFAGLAAGFGIAAWRDFYGVGEAMLIVTFVMGALALAFLASALIAGRRRRP